MKEIVRKYFIPGLHNDFHPHILHRKRSLFYGGFFLATKMIVMAFVAVVTPQAFLLPEVMAEEQKQIIALTNKVRADKGLVALSIDSKLGISSFNKADDMAVNGYFAHANDGKNLSFWISSAGYRYNYAGENLAVGFSTAEDIVAAWEKSPTHYANLLDGDYSDVGVGLVAGTYKGQPTVFVAQHLAQPRKPAAPAVIETPKPAALAKPETVTESAAVPFVPVPTKAETPPEHLPLALVPENEIAPEPVLEIAQPGSVAGEQISDREFEAPAVVETVPAGLLERYLIAKKVMKPVTGIFGVEKAIYLSALLFFLASLAIMIFVAIRVQRPRAIAWTCALIGFLAILWKF